MGVQAESLADLGTLLALFGSWKFWVKLLSGRVQSGANGLTSFEAYGALLQLSKKAPTVRKAVT